MPPFPKREPIRPKKLRNAARGQRCTLNLPGICSYDSETVVLTHLHDETFGKGQKADDLSAIHACFKCHTALDTGTHELDRAELFELLLRALQRTIRRVSLMEVIISRATAQRSTRPGHASPEQNAKPYRRSPSTPPAALSVCSIATEIERLEAGLE